MIFAVMNPSVNAAAKAASVSPHLKSGGSSGDLSSSVGYQDAMNKLAVATAERVWEKQAEADKIAMQFTHDENELAWQRQMQASNTAYQRAVADMKAAGLNPLLALGNPASTPSSSGGHGISSARQAPQLNLDNTVASFKNLLRELDQQDKNAHTAAEAQKHVANVHAAAEIFKALIPLATAPTGGMLLNLSPSSQSYAVIPR